MIVLGKYKQVFAAVIAIGILAAIFVPFQKANAYTIDTALPDSTSNAVTQNTFGESFKVTIGVQPSEFFSINEIEMTLDNGQPGVKHEIFSGSGSLLSGDPGIMIENILTVSPTSPLTTGYGYGFGRVSSGTTFSAPYSYAFTSSYAFISGNAGGYSNAVASANTVSGLVGPVTVTISGKLNTAALPAGTHTLDVMINTGSKGNNIDRVPAPTLSFTVASNAAVVTKQVDAQPLVTLTDFYPVQEEILRRMSARISNIDHPGELVVERVTSNALKLLFDLSFRTIGKDTAIFQVGTSDANTAGPILNIEASTIKLGPGGSYEITIPYDPSLLPTGFNEANVKFMHFNTQSLKWEDKTISVDIVGKTVTGRLTALSPVVAGFIVSSSTSTSTGLGGGGGGGGGGGSSAIDLTPDTTTYSDGYFLTNPLAKVQVQNSAFVNTAGQNVFGAISGQQVSISTTFKNYQQGEQDYAIIIQIIDSNGFTTDLGWTAGKLEGGAIAQASRSWTTDEEGSYTVKMFVWNGVSQAPTPLSEVTTRNFIVT